MFANPDLMVRPCFWELPTSLKSCLFSKKNVGRALMVVKQMKEAGVKPDSTTYGYLINNCNREAAITKVKFRSFRFPDLLSTCSS